MVTNLVEMFNAALVWVTIILDAPSAKVVVFGVRIQGHVFLEVLLGFFIVYLLSRKSDRPPRANINQAENR